MVISCYQPVNFKPWYQSGLTQKWYQRIEFYRHLEYSKLLSSSVNNSYRYLNSFSSKSRLRNFPNHSGSKLSVWGCSITQFPLKSLKSTTECDGSDPGSVEVMMRGRRLQVRPDWTYLHWNWLPNQQELANNQNQQSDWPGAHYGSFRKVGFYLFWCTKVVKNN